MTDCYYEKKDWRACKNEVSGVWPLPASDLPTLSAYSLATAMARIITFGRTDWFCPDGGVQGMLEASRERAKNRLEGRMSGGRRPAVDFSCYPATMCRE